MLNWKCALPKGADAIKRRAKSVGYEAVSYLAFLALFALSALGDTLMLPWLTLGSFAAIVCLAIKLSRIPYQERGEAAECGKPQLETDEQIERRGVRELHDVLMVGSLFVGFLLGLGIFTYTIGWYVAGIWF